MKAHVVDCDILPFIPEGMTVEKHQKGGKLKLDMSKVQLYLSKLQKDGKYFTGHELREKLKGQPVLNANVLDYLIEHPELIPASWETAFFWGTIYRNADGELYVRYLWYRGSGWRSDYGFLGCGWISNSPAAVRAN